MLSILDLLNHYLGFFNVNTKLKGRVYTILALVGNFYLLYLAISYFSNGAILRGVLLSAAFLVIAYFVVVNFFYYFLKHNFKWDISPIIERKIGTQETTVQAGPVIVPANGLYTSDHVLPASAISTPDMQAELAVVMAQLAENKLVETDFGGLSENEQLKRLEQETTVFANDPGTPLPYFRLEKGGTRLVLVGGINEMLAKPLANLDTIGLMPAQDAAHRYDLFIASAVITGGIGHQRGRSGLTEVTLPYMMKIEVAYKEK